VDAPMVVAGSRRELLERAFEQAHAPEEEEDFRPLLLSLCGDNSDSEARERATEEGLVPAALVERIVAHNYHVVDPPPIDRNVPEGGRTVCGLWPLGSIVNHSLHPNATRTFAGHANCYRLLRDLSPGEELLDNYLDPRLPHSERATILKKVHGMRDEGPDAFDAPAQVLGEIEGRRAEVERLLQEDRVEGAFRLLGEVAVQCERCGHRDPAFTEIFRAHADVAGQLTGDTELRLRCLTKALEYATAREAFSSVSCLLAAELLAAALEGPPPVAAGERAWAEALAREHVRRTYGPEEGIFETLNPTLSELLRASKPATDSCSKWLESLD